MRGLSAQQLLRLPVRMRGIELGRPVDLIVDPESERVLGLDVLCGDHAHRFLPLAAATVLEGEIQIRSPLLLIDFGQASFYRERTSTFAALRGAMIHGDGFEAALRDLVLWDDGGIAELVVRDDGGERRVPLDGLRLPTP